MLLLLLVYDSKGKVDPVNMPLILLLLGYAASICIINNMQSSPAGQRQPYRIVMSGTIPKKQ